MDSPAPQRISGLAAALIVASLILGAAIVSASFMRATTTTETATSTLTTAVGSLLVDGGPSLFTSGVSPSGLQLEIAMNSSSIESHGALSVQVEVVNTLGKNVSFSMPPWSGVNQGIPMWSGYDELCYGNPSDYVVGFELLQGHYSAANFSAAGGPLREIPPFYPPCPSVFYPSDVTILPHSDVTNYTAVNYSVSPPRPVYQVRAEVDATTLFCTGYEGAPPETGAPVDCGTTTGLLGFWNGSVSSVPQGGDWYNYSSPAFTYFPPGEYTIVATDALNQYVFATFVVLPAQLPD